MADSMARQALQGNRDDAMAPHDCYPCRGEDRWISIAVVGDDEWRALCRAMDQPSLADDPRFADARSRLRNSDAVDAVVATWTR